MRYGIVLAVAILASTPVEAAMQHAVGTFDVEMAPEASVTVDGIATARVNTTKVFHGDLAATASGQMLTAMGTVDGSAAYVLIETVAGTLDGKAGGFVLMHAATMDRGAPDQRIVVVPDSGTGALAGLAGNMTIRLDGGAHRYDLAYELVLR